MVADGNDTAGGGLPGAAGSHSDLAAQPPLGLSAQRCGGPGSDRVARPAADGKPVATRQPRK